MQTVTSATELVALAKMNAARNVAYLLNTFSFVPDDKLTWSPSSTSKSALRIVAHCAVSNYGISNAIRGEEMPEGVDMPAMMKMMEEKELAITTREQAIAAVNESLEIVMTALDTVTDERIGGTSDSPFGAMPMMFWIFLPGNHIGGHAYQIDFLQTIWGDNDFHFPTMS